MGRRGRYRLRSAFHRQLINEPSAKKRSSLQAIANMIKSLWKIEFVTASGTHLLLDHGDYISEEVKIGGNQSTAVSAPIFQKFASSFPLGGMACTTQWTRIREVTRPRTTATREHNAFPWGVAGYVRVSILEGDAFVYLRSSIKGISPSYNLPFNYLLQAYSAELGPPDNPIFSADDLLHTSRSVGAAGNIYAPTISGGLAAYSAAIVGGALPAGYSLTTSGAECGKITGTPTTAGVYSWTLALSDARGAKRLYDHTITITP